MLQFEISTDPDLKTVNLPKTVDYDKVKEALDFDSSSDLNSKFQNFDGELNRRNLTPEQKQNAEISWFERNCYREDLLKKAVVDKKAEMKSTVTNVAKQLGIKSSVINSLVDKLASTEFRKGKPVITQDDIDTIADAMDADSDISNEKMLYEIGRIGTIESSVYEELGITKEEAEAAGKPKRGRKRKSDADLYQETVNQVPVNTETEENQVPQVQNQVQEENPVQSNEGESVPVENTETVAPAETNPVDEAIERTGNNIANGVTNIDSAQNIQNVQNERDRRSLTTTNSTDNTQQNTQNAQNMEEQESVMRAEEARRAKEKAVKDITEQAEKQKGSKLNDEERALVETTANQVVREEQENRDYEKSRDDFFKKRKSQTKNAQYERTSDYQQEQKADNRAFNDNQEEQNFTNSIKASKAAERLMSDKNTPKGVKKVLDKAFKSHTLDDRFMYEVTHNDAIWQKAKENFEKNGIAGMVDLAKEVGINRDRQHGARMHSLQEQVDLEYASVATKQIIKDLETEYNKLRDMAKQAGYTWEYKDGKATIKDIKTGREFDTVDIGGKQFLDHGTIEHIENVYEDLNQSWADIFDVTASVLTDSGKALQAAKLMYDTPEYRMRYMQQKINDMGQKRGKTVHVDDALWQKFLTAPTQDARDKAMRDIENVVAPQVASFKDKLNEWRYVAMLCNPVTHIRNIVSNAMTYASFRATDGISDVIEKQLDGKYINAKDINTRNTLGEKAIESLKKEEINNANALGRAAKENNISYDVFAMDKSDFKRFAKTYRLDTASGKANLNADTERDIRNRETLGEDKIKQIKDDIYNQKKDIQKRIKATGISKAVFNMNTEQFQDYVKENTVYNRHGMTDKATRDFARKYFKDNHIGESTTSWNDKTGQWETVRADKFNLNLNNRLFNEHGKLGGLAKFVNDIAETNSNLLSAEDDFFIDKRFAVAMSQELRKSGYMLSQDESGNTVLIPTAEKRAELAKQNTERGMSTEVNSGELTAKPSATAETLSKAESDDILAQISNRAYQSALEATYHDYNDFAKWIEKGRRSKFGIILDATMPFSTTPANILRRSVEFSPIGLAKTVSIGYKQVKQGKISANTYVEQMARGLNGTGLAALGAFLFKAGVLSAGDDDDDDSQKSYYEGDVYGKQAFSLHIGDHTYSLDWAMPSVAGIITGAAIAQEFEKWQVGDSDASNIIPALISTINPILNSSMLSGLASSLSDLVDDNGNIDLSSGVSTALQSYILQFFPSAFSAINRTIDEKKRYTYDQNFGTRLKNNILMRLPGGSFFVPESVNDHGEVSKNIGTIEGHPVASVATRLAVNTLVPPTVKRDYHTSLDDELVRLREQTGKNVLAGNQRTLKDANGAETSLSSREMMNEKKIYAKEYMKDAQDFFKSDVYNMYDGQTDDNGKPVADEYKGAVMADLYKYATDKARIDYFGKVGQNAEDLMTGINLTAYKLEQKGVNPYVVFAQKEAPNMDTTEKAYAMRDILESHDAFDEVRSLAKGDEIKLSNLGLNAKVANMTDDEFAYAKENYVPKETQTTVYSDDDLKVNQAEEGVMKKAGVNIQKFYAAKATKGTKDSKGSQITYSQDINARKTLGEDEVSKIKSAIDRGDTTMDEAARITGINEKILSMDSDHFDEFAKNNKSNYDTALNNADALGVPREALLASRDATSDYDNTGKTIKKSGAINARLALGEDNWQKYYNAVRTGKISIDQAVKDTGISKSVFKMSSAEFTAKYGGYNVKYSEDEEGTASNSGYETSGSKSGSKRSSKKSSKSTSEGYYDKNGKYHQSDAEKAQMNVLRAFAKAMAARDDSYAKSTEKQLNKAMSALSSGDQKIYDSIMGSKSMKNKLDLYGIKVTSDTD